MVYPHLWGWVLAAAASTIRTVEIRSQVNSLSTLLRRRRDVEATPPLGEGPRPARGVFLRIFASLPITTQGTYVRTG